MKSYNEMGYAIYPQVVEDKLLDRVIYETRRTDIEPLDKWKVIENSAIMELAYHNKIMEILEGLYGYRPFPFQTLNFYTSPSIRLHADTIHFHTDPPGWMCGVWIALEDVGEENGPLIYYPESHKLPVVTFEDLGIVPYKDKEILQQNLLVYSDFLSSRVDEEGLKAEKLICEKGSMLVWSSNLYHMSQKPSEGTTRMTQVTHYYFDVPNIKYTVPAFGEGTEKVDPFGMENHFLSGPSWL